MKGVSKSPRPSWNAKERFKTFFLVKKKEGKRFRLNNTRDRTGLQVQTISTAEVHILQQNTFSVIIKSIDSIRFQTNILIGADRFKIFKIA